MTLAALGQGPHTGIPNFRVEEGDDRIGVLYTEAETIEHDFQGAGVGERVPPARTTNDEMTVIDQ